MTHQIEQASRTILDVTTCKLVSTTYHPSAIEKEWTENAGKWAGRSVSVPTFCSNLARDFEEIETISSLVTRLMEPPSKRQMTRHHLAPLTSSPLTQGSRLLLSHFQFKFDCGVMGERSYLSPIQPLIGSLRHPLFPCKDPERVLGDRGYMLLASSIDAPYRFPSRVGGAEKAKVHVFDLGASTFDQGLGGASQQWFVDKLESRGFLIDSYYAWEAAPLLAEEIYRRVPKALLPRYHYFNVPASSDVNDLANPLNTIKAVVKRDDYVVFKLDIDNSKVEMEFIEQILADSELHSLIDELFFEHHVNFQPLNEYWRTENETMQLEDSYEIFRRLRDLGIRAHGWN